MSYKKHEGYERQISYNMMERMERKGISQRILADLMGVSPNAVSHWYNGKNEPTIYCLKRMADVFGCKMEDLISEVDY